MCSIRLSLFDWLPKFSEDWGQFLRTFVLQCI